MMTGLSSSFYCIGGDGPEYHREQDSNLLLPWSRGWSGSKTCFQQRSDQTCQDPHLFYIYSRASKLSLCLIFFKIRRKNMLDPQWRGLENSRRRWASRGLTKVTGAVTLGDVSPAGGPRSPHRGRRVDVIHVSPGRRVLVRTAGGRGGKAAGKRWGGAKREEIHRFPQKPNTEPTGRTSSARTESATELWSSCYLTGEAGAGPDMGDLSVSCLQQNCGGNGALLLSGTCWWHIPHCPPPWRGRLLSCPAGWLRSNCCSGASARHFKRSAAPELQQNSSKCFFLKIIAAKYFNHF